MTNSTIPQRFIILVLSNLYLLLWARPTNILMAVPKKRKSYSRKRLKNILHTYSLKWSRKYGSSKIQNSSN